MKKARDAGRKTKLVRDKLYIDGSSSGSQVQQRQTSDDIKFQNAIKCKYFIFLNSTLCHIQKLINNS